MTLPAATIAKIIAKKRALDIAKKKVAKVSEQEARKAASKMSERVGGSKPLSRPRGSGNMPTRPTNVPKKNIIKEIPKKTPKQTSKEKAVSQYFKKEKLWTGLKNPPKPKPKTTNVLHDRPITKRQLEMNKFALKRNLKERRKIEKTYKGIRKGRVQERTPNRSIFEREMNIPAGSGPSVRRQQAVKELRQEIQTRNEARLSWQRQARDSAISPKTTVHPSAVERSWQSDRNAINAVREAERLSAKNKTRKYGTGGGRPARKSKGN